MQLNVFSSNRSGESWLIRYGFAVLLVALATGIRIALRPIIPTGFPFLTFFLAVMLAAWRGGLGPGLLASILSTLAVDLLLIEPLYEFHLAAGYYRVSLGVFVVETVAISMLTEHVKRTQETLRENEARLKSILNHAPAAIFIKDPAGRYLFMNEECARVLSVNREQALGRTDRDLFSPELAAQFIANDQRVWESERLLTVEERVPQADGVHTSMVKKFLLWDEQGRPYGLKWDCAGYHPRLEAGGGRSGE
jgi:PAS domain S-box-containing protein